MSAEGWFKCRQTGGFVIIQFEKITAENKAQNDGLSNFPQKSGNCTKNLGRGSRTANYFITRTITNNNHIG